MKPPMDSNVAETLGFITAVEQLLEKNMMQQCKLCASKLKQHRDLLHSLLLSLPIVIGQSFTWRKVEHPATHPIPIAKVFYKGEAHPRPTISEKCTIYQGSTDPSASQPLAPEHNFESSTFLPAWSNSVNGFKLPSLLS